MPVSGVMWPTIWSEHPRIAGRPDRRVESQPTHVFGHDKGGHRFEHRHLDGLAAAGAAALEQCRHYSVDHSQSDRLVTNQGRDKTRFAARRHLKRNKPASSLDDVIKGRPVGERAILAVAVGGAIDQPRVDLAQPFLRKTEPSHRLRAHVVHKHIGLAARASNTGAASGCFRSSTRERLLRLRFRKTWPISRCLAGPA